jgi:hypothetical protein
MFEGKFVWLGDPLNKVHDFLQKEYAFSKVSDTEKHFKPSLVIAGKALGLTSGRLIFLHKISKMIELYGMIFEICKHFQA